jgi:Peptidase propeptide and YPEB domain
MTNKSYTIWRTILIAGTVIGLAGIVGEMVWSGDNGKLQGAEVIALATSTRITVDGAVETALGTMAGQVIEAKLEKRGDKTVWNIGILTTQEAIMTIYVDAVSGVMMLTEEKVPGKKPAEVKTL